MTPENTVDLALAKTRTHLRRQFDLHGYDARTMLVEMVRFIEAQDGMGFMGLATTRCSCGKKAVMVATGLNRSDGEEMIDNGYKTAVLAAGAAPGNPCTQDIIGFAVKLKD